MSYSLTVHSVTKGDDDVDTDGQIATTIDSYVDSQFAGHDAVDEVREHLAAAQEAIGTLVAAVGRPGDSFSVSISGHANPDHGPTEGWSDEHISIHISCTHAR